MHLECIFSFRLFLDGHVGMNVAFDSLRGLGSALAVLKAVEKLAYGKLLVDKRGAKRARGGGGIEEG